MYTFSIYLPSMYTFFSTLSYYLFVSCTDPQMVRLRRWSHSFYPLLRMKAGVAQFTHQNPNFVILSTNKQGMQAGFAKLSTFQDDDTDSDSDSDTDTDTDTG